MSAGSDIRRARGPGAEERILTALVELSDVSGYERLSVERVIRAAAVSRASFYQYFSCLDDCFVAAFRLHADRLVETAQAACSSHAEGERLMSVLVEMTIAAPSVARLLLREGLAAGPVGLAERDALIARLIGLIDADQAPRFDLPAEVLIGGVVRFLAMRLSDGQPLGSLHEELRAWRQVFEIPTRGASWGSRLAPGPLGGAVESADGEVSLPRGLSLRERILYATAAAIRMKGYRQITVTDIVSSAGVSRRSFYNEFASRADAFIAAYELGFQRTMAACTPAFFSSRDWPERVWEGAQAFTNVHGREPLLSYLGFVECYALGPDFLLRVHDTQLAFTLFLEDGYRQRPEGASLNRVCSTLTAATIFELAFQSARQAPSVYLRRMQPLAVFIALAPFIGRQAAGEFVLEKLGRRGGASSAVA